MRGAEGKFFLHLPPDSTSTTLTTDIESHLRTLEAEGKLSVTFPSCHRNSCDVLEVE
jgi:hypothetical protein